LHDELVGSSCNASQSSQTVACTLSSGQTTCAPQGDGTYAWSACAKGACNAGQTQACSMQVLVGYSGTSTGSGSGAGGGGGSGPGIPQYADFPGTQSCEIDETGNGSWGPCQSSAESTPLVFSFDGGAVQFSNPAGVFGLDPTHSVATDWPSAVTPWLALDRNGDGNIADGGELFGSATMLSDGTFAKNGFQALAELDDNHDGVIDARDHAFDKLVLWSDRNQDRTSDPSELVSLRAAGIESISLDYGSLRHCDLRGNCEVESARFVFRGERGEQREGRVIDVHLAHH